MLENISIGYERGKQVVYYPTTDEKLRERLWKLKLEYGYFKRVLSEKAIYDTLQVVVAHGPRGGIQGWAGIYNPNPYANISNFYSKAKIDTFIGVYVDNSYRHMGIGTRLKEEAIKICVSQGRDYCWCDRKDDDKFVKVDVKTNTEKRFYQYSFGLP